VQGFDGKRHFCRFRILRHFGNGIFDLRPRVSKIFGWRTSWPRILRQAADNKHDAWGAERMGFIDRSAIVVAHFNATRGVRCEHATTTIAGKLNSGITYRMRRAPHADNGNLVTPRVDGADAMTRAGVDDRQQVALLANGCGVERQPTMIDREIPHHASRP
jgi:hypothetical protein